MVISYLGQRQVEVGALNASFEPIRALLDGRSGPQTPRLPPKMRLHVPESWLLHRKRKPSASPEPQKQPSPRTTPDERASQIIDAGNNSSAMQSLEHGTAEQQIALEHCVSQAIHMAGFGREFVELQAEERREILTELRQGLMTQMHAIFQAHSLTTAPQPSVQSIKEHAENLLSAHPAQTRAATSPDLEFHQTRSQQLLGESRSKKRPQDKQRQVTQDSAQPVGPLSRYQAAPSPIRKASAVENAAVAKQLAQDRALQGASWTQHALQRPQQSQQNYQQLQQLRQLQAFKMQQRGSDASGQVRTWPDLPVVFPQRARQASDSERGMHGKGLKGLPSVSSQMNMSTGEVTSTPTTQVHSMESLPWQSENSQQRATTMSMDSLPHMAVRSMDSLPHVAVATMDSLPEIAENSTEDAEGSPPMSVGSQSTTIHGGRPWYFSPSSSSFPPQSMTCPNLPDYQESDDSSLRASSLPRVMLEFERRLESGALHDVNAMRPIPGSELPQSQQLQSTTQLQQLIQQMSQLRSLAPPQAAAHPAFATGSAGLTSASLSSNLEANRRFFKAGPVGSRGVSSAAAVSLPTQFPPQTHPTPVAEPPLPPLPLSLLPGAEVTYSL